METIETKEKLVFSAMIGREPLEILARHLKEEHAIESRISFKGYPYRYDMYVDKNDYQTAIAMGSLFADDNLKGLVAWVDSNNVEQRIGFIPIMYGMLPQNREGNSMWAYFDSPTSLCPEDLKTYINDLKEFCAVDQVSLIYNMGSNAFTILAKAPFAKHELIQKRCKGFNYVNEYTPFIETYYPNWNNSLDIDFEKSI